MDSRAASDFPLHVDSAHRQLVDSHNVPFLLMGDAAWSLIAQLSLRDARIYLEARRASGFNAVLVNLVEHEFATDAPANHSGDLPFREPNNLATPNDAYFDHAHKVLDLAESLGFLVLLTPAYTGFEGGEQGWYSEMKSTGRDGLRRYGKYLGRTFARHENIIWVEGGDYDLPDKGLVDAVATGIAETDPGALQTFNGARGSTVREGWGDRPWFVVDNIYTDHHPLDAARDAYRFGAHPFFLLEGYYENEHSTTQADLRRQAYDTVLAGGIGQIFGNNPMWHFDAPGLFPVPTTWQQELSSAGTVSMTQFTRLFSSMPWWNLRPDDGTFLTSGSGDKDPAVASVGCDGSSAVVYVPRTMTVRVDLSKLGGAPSMVWWDPTDGHTVPVERVQTASPVSLSTPGSNAAGDPDWLLVAGPTDSAARSPTRSPAHP